MADRLRLELADEGEPASRYRVVPADRSYCPHCQRHPVLLATEGPSDPAFYICRNCGFIGQVGVGPVRNSTDAEQTQLRAKGDDDGSAL